jgi:Protein of unknown function (DUF1488)
MPLSRAKTGEPSAETNGIVFPMEDEGGVLVICEVSYDYLRRRTGVTISSVGKEMLLHFGALRDEIEEIARGKYEKQKQPPFVTSDDI